MAGDQKKTENEIRPGSSIVEEAYLQGIRQMGGMGRVQRTCSLFGTVYRMIRHQVTKENPGLSERQIRIKVARVLYQSDPNAQKLLDRAEQL